MDVRTAYPLVEEKLGYTFRDRRLLIQAFTRGSFCNEANRHIRVPYQSNEVLEFFGDAVLGAAVITFLLRDCVRRYEHGISTSLGEGDFSNIKAHLSDKSNLSKSIHALGFQKWMLLGEGDRKMGIEEEPSVMEDLFESIVGAVYIDCGQDMETVTQVVGRILDMSAFFRREQTPIIQSPKNALQEYCADRKRRMGAPQYETVQEDGPDHKREFVRAVFIDGVEWGRGVGKNTKAADAAAATAALEALRKREERS